MIALAPPGVRVGITGLGASLPCRALSSEDVARSFGESEAWILERTGIRERRVAAPEEAASDLAAAAARAALARAGCQAEEVDVVIVATASPDTLFPSTASVVAAGIGADRAAAFDLSAACTGFVYALAQAYCAVASGAARRVLVVGSEVMTRFLDWEDRSTCILFGDGAGAAVVEPVDEGGVLAFELGNDGSRAGDLRLPAGGSRAPATAETVRDHLHTVKMNGQEVFRFSTRVATASALRVLELAGLGVDDVDVFAPHQANRRIVELVARRLGVPVERTLLNIDRYGNTSAASIPLVLDEASREGRLPPGSNVLMCAVGAGMTWGSLLLRWTGEGGDGR